MVKRFFHNFRVALKIGVNPSLSILMFVSETAPWFIGTYSLFFTSNWLLPYMSQVWERTEPDLKCFVWYQSSWESLSLPMGLEPWSSHYKSGALPNELNLGNETYTGTKLSYESWNTVIGFFQILWLSFQTTTTGLFSYFGEKRCKNCIVAKQNIVHILEKLHFEDISPSNIL